MTCMMRYVTYFSINRGAGGGLNRVGGGLNKYLHLKRGLIREGGLI